MVTIPIRSYLPEAGWGEYSSNREDAFWMRRVDATDLDLVNELFMGRRVTLREPTELYLHETDQPGINFPWVVQGWVAWAFRQIAKVRGDAETIAICDKALEKIQGRQQKEELAV